MTDTFTQTKMQWLEQITFDRDLIAASARTGYAIAYFLSRKEGCARPSIPRLASDMGVSENTVRAGIRALVSGGHLEVEEGGGRNTANRYRIILRAEKPFKPLQGNDAPKPCSAVKGNGANKGCSPLQGISEKPFNPASETLQSSDDKPFSRLNPNPLIEPIEEPTDRNISVNGASKTSLQDEFEQAWTRYPRKVSKGTALKAFRAARKIADLDTITAGVTRYAAERSGADPKFTKHFSSWLTARCWEDEAPPPHSPSLTTSAGRHDGKGHTLAVLQHLRAKGNGHE